MQMFWRSLGYRCGQLQSFVLDGCYRVSDIGISALRRGCGNLQSINLGGFRYVTDEDASS